MIFHVSPKSNEEGEIKTADVMAKSIFNLDFKYTGLLYMTIYLRSVINLCEMVPCAVPPKSKLAGLDHPIDTGTKMISVSEPHKSSSG